MGTTSYFDSPGKESFKIGNWQHGDEEFKEGEMYARALEGMDIDEEDEIDDDEDEDAAGIRELKKLQDK